LAKKEIELGKIREHSAKLLGAGALTGTLLIAPPTNLELPGPNKVVQEIGSQTKSVANPRDELLKSLHETLPSVVGPLNRDQEKSLEMLFQNVLGVKSKATLEGEHLNTTYGKIGAEQHLRRFPGDTNDQHAPKKDQYGGDRPYEILKEGTAPGLGAWGYFAPTKSAFTPNLEEKERWYAVVQTLYYRLGFSSAISEDWYKYRKV
jgi:hypothetical protein